METTKKGLPETRHSEKVGVWEEMPDSDDLLTPWCTCFGSQAPAPGALLWGFGFAVPIQGIGFRVP